MKQIITTSRIIAFLPNDSIENINSSSINLIRQIINDLGLVQLPFEKYVFSCEVDENGIGGNRNNYCIVDTFKGSTSVIDDAVNKSARSTVDSIDELCEKSIQFYNIWNIEPDSISVRSDYFAHKYFYYVQAFDGIIISSKVADLVSILPSLLDTEDRRGIAWQLVFGFLPGSTTLHKKVNRSRAASRYCWSVQEKFSQKSDNRLMLSPIDPLVSLSESIDSIYQATQSSVVNRCDYGSKRKLIGLSGGFDSRLLAAICKEKNVELDAYTYGNSWHGETISAKEVAKTLGIKHHILKYPKNVLYDSLNIFLDTIEGHGDLQVAQICNLLKTNLPGNSLLHGYLGGPLSGHHIGRFRKEVLTDYDSACEEIYTHFSNNAAYTNLELLSINYHVDDFKSDIRNDLILNSNIYQSVRMWEFNNVQRDNIGSTLRLVGKKYHVIAPLYDQKVIEAWLKLPLISLADRYVFRQIIREKFPSMAVIPHSEEMFGIQPSLKYHLLAVLRYLRNDFHKYAIETTIGIKSYTDPSYIWILSHGGASKQQREHLINRYFKNTGSLRRVFNVRDLSDPDKVMLDKNKVSRSGLDFMRRLYTLGEYASYITDKIR